MKTSNQIEQFVSDYKSCRTKSAHSVLAQASIYKKAKMTLTSKLDYQQFCTRIGEEPNSSYLKKLHCIASKNSRFESIIDSLPPCYTALYFLSKLDDIKFQQLVEDKRIHPTLKLKDISSLTLSQAKNLSPTRPTQSLRVTIEINDLSHLQTLNAELAQLKIKYSFLKIHDNPIQIALKQSTSVKILSQTAPANDASDIRSAA